MQNSNILELPDELLISILELVAFTTIDGEYCIYDRSARDHKVVKSLALVCHRFHSIVLPLLYYEISLRARKVVINKQLYQRFEKHPLV